MVSIRSLRRLVLIALMLIPTGPVQAADSILPGYDLFHTLPGTFYDFQGFAGLGPLDFEGNPIGAFDFGGGPVGVGDTDTIVQRLGTATTGTPTIAIEIVELSLQSVAPVDIGNGPEFILIDLSSHTAGQMTINGLATEGDPHGTFDSTLQFNFDVTGTTSGFLGTIPTTITQTGADWRHEAIFGEPQIPNVNFLLNGLDELNDFWPLEPVQEQHPGPGVHVASAGTPLAPPTVPILPIGGLVALAAGFVLLLGRAAMTPDALHT